jgi:hypothetical protein
MIEPPLLPDPRVERWLQRHARPASLILHLIGIPPTLLGALFLVIYLTSLSWPIFMLALALFVGGYLLQFAGHFQEGTDPGEIIYFKRKLGRPYVEFPRRRGGADGPRFEAHPASGPGAIGKSLNPAVPFPTAGPLVGGVAPDRDDAITRRGNLI